MKCHPFELMKQKLLGQFTGVNISADFLAEIMTAQRQQIQHSLSPFQLINLQDSEYERQEEK